MEEPTGENVEVVEPGIETPAEIAEVPKKNSGSNFYKEKLSKYEQENAELRNQMETIQSKNLEEKENFKQLWELEKQRRVEAEEKATSVAQNYFNGLKMSAIEQEALKLGVRTEALEDFSRLDTGMVEVETTDMGNANVLGAKEFVETIKERKPHWFKTGTAPNINNANPAMAKEKKLSGYELAELQEKDPVAYKAYNQKHFGLR